MDRHERNPLTDGVVRAAVGIGGIGSALEVVRTGCRSSAGSRLCTLALPNAL
jgi:hypothetical protein